MTAIRDASRDALDEVRTVLAVLRAEGDVPRTPGPALDDVGPLVAQVRAGGLPVDLAPEPLGDLAIGVPGPVQAAAFRVVQESLTNITRHARATSATVRLRREPDTLRSRCPTTVARAPVSEGRGLLGMRERARALGGTVDVAVAAERRPAGRRPLPAGSGAGARMIDVVVADDQALVRAGFRALLDAEPGLRVVGEAADGEAALEVVRRTHPDVVLMDIRMPGLDGLAATGLIAADPELSGTRVLVLTTFELDEYVFEALRVGASGFLVKDTEPADLVKAVRAVAARRRPALAVRDPPADRARGRRGEAVAARASGRRPADRA